MLPLDEVRDEIENGPLAADLAPIMAGGDENGVADVLNDRTGKGAGRIPCSIPVPYLLQWAVACNLRGAIARAASDPNHISYNECLGIEDMFRGAMAGSHQGSYQFDTPDPSISGPGGLIDRLIAGSVFTQQNKDALIAYSTTEASRVEIRWGLGSFMTSDDVSNAFGRF